MKKFPPVRAFFFLLAFCVFHVPGPKAADSLSAAAPAIDARDPRQGPAAPSAAAKAPVPAELDEEDILVEEGEESAIVQEQSGTAPGGSAEAVPNQDGASPATEAAEAPSAAGMNAATAAPKKDSATVVTAAVARVEESRSINFAENVKGYRSPKLAMLMSLLVPGLGQAYSKEYWRTGAFLAVEAGIIGVSVGFARKGQEFYRRAKAHADTAYSYEAFKGYYDSLKTGIEQSSRSADNRELVDTVMDELFFGDEKILASESRKSEDFYSLIERDVFVWGWKDRSPGYSSEMVLNEEGSVLPFRSGDTTFVTSYATRFEIPFKIKRQVKGETISSDELGMYGFSPFYDTYLELISRKNHNYRIAGNVLYAMLVNHIVSALDAGIAAKRFNDRLLNTQSVWDRIELQQQFVNTGSEDAPGLSLTVKF